jgi:hypothetical protein
MQDLSWPNHERIPKSWLYATGSYVPEDSAVSKSFSEFANFVEKLDNLFYQIISTDYN